MQRRLRPPRNQPRRLKDLTEEERQAFFADMRARSNFRTASAAIIMITVTTIINSMRENPAARWIRRVVNLRTHITRLFAPCLQRHNSLPSKC